MLSLKAAFVVVVSAVLSLPALAQAPAAPTRGPKTTNPVSTAGGAKAATPAIAVPSKQTSAGAAKIQKARAGSKAAKGKKVPEPQPQAQLPPPPPPTPAQLPPTPARVTMRNGLLTIEANNSTLADVLTGVRRETKAAIDLPAGASGERVVASIGPGTPQNVLTSLLNGSRFDYIILGSQDQPDAVQRVILRAKSGPEPAPAGQQPVVAQRGPNPGGVNAPQPTEPDEADEQGAPQEEVPDENNGQQQQPQQEIDGEQQQGQQQQQQQQGVKTPEQLLEELRQMQQQQQQGQDQQQQQQQPQQQQPQIYQQPQQQPQNPQQDEQ